MSELQKILETKPHDNSGLPVCLLSEYSLITCTGEEAEFFLQGQITCDIKKISNGQAQFTANCNAKGRVVGTFYLIRNDNVFYLLVKKSNAENLITHLTKYILFSKVTLEANHNLHCLGVSGVIKGALALSDTQNILVGTAHQLEESLSETLSITMMSNEQWHTQSIQNGVAELPKESSEKFVAQRLNLHQISGAINFNKGCYIGQEVVARIHFKGKVKHHMHLGKLPAVTLKQDTIIVDQSQNKIAELVDYVTMDNTTYLLFVTQHDANHDFFISDNRINTSALNYKHNGIN